MNTSESRDRHSLQDSNSIYTETDVDESASSLAYSHTAMTTSEMRTNIQSAEASPGAFRSPNTGRRGETKETVVTTPGSVTGTMVSST